MAYTMGPAPGAMTAGPVGTANAEQQRNNIAQALMNISNPLPRTPMPQMPQTRPMMGITPTSVPGAPPQGTPTPGVTQPSIPATAGVPPMNPMQMATGQPQQSAPMPQQGMPPQ